MSSEKSCYNVSWINPSQIAAPDFQFFFSQIIRSNMTVSQIENGVKLCTAGNIYIAIRYITVYHTVYNTQ